MKIRDILIQNFRGIDLVQATNIGETVIVAGQNGSGKSCIFDAIRLLKSTYGGYMQNEWQQFFGEFQIQLHGGAKQLSGLFNDRTKAIVIECVFQLRASEKKYILENSSELVEEAIWKTLLPEAFQFGGYQRALFANQFRERRPEVEARVKVELPGLMAEISKNEIHARIEIPPAGNIGILQSRLLTVIFSNFRPRNIGVIDFHGAQRHYGREIVQGINLSLDQKDQQYSQHTLYNYNNKYNNVKSEMAGSFVRILLSEASKRNEVNSNSISDEVFEESVNLSKTLQELFTSFFPDKKFLGPRPTADGSLEFPVETRAGHQHDLDELSSGEKEILYGYLRIRSSAPRNSIILLDEPELHLNPRLIRGLPEFYRKHLGEALDNQIWLITHSDALLREAIGKPGFNVFHMLPANASEDHGSQLRPLHASGDLDLVLADLVGDLAAYRPGGKGLIFEGGGDSDFDKTFVSRLFPEEIRGINLISGTNKERVKVLHEVLDRAYKDGSLPTKFYAIVDSDSDIETNNTPALNIFKWTVYHIENYLLDFSIIKDVLNSLSLAKVYGTEVILESLTASARIAAQNLIIHKLRSSVNSMLVKSIDLGFSPNTTSPAIDLFDAVERSVSRIQNARSDRLTRELIEEKEKQIRTEIDMHFADGSWLSKIPGRDILKNFIQVERLNVSYEVFRNLLLSRMAERGLKPQGVQEILEHVAKD